jgi:hypothetical protein
LILIPRLSRPLKKPVRAQGDDLAKLRIELTIGSSIYWRLITPAEADKVLQLSTEPWMNKKAE